MRAPDRLFHRRARADPAARHLTLSSTAGGPGATVVIAADGSGYAFTGDLPALPAGRTYQLWALGGADGRTPISIGVLGRDPDVSMFRADARALPLEDGKADFVFMDPPYSTHLEYSGDAACIGDLSAFDEAYFEAMKAVFAEAERVLRDRRYLAVLVGDTFKKKRGFVGIGARFHGMLARRFRAIDHVAVVRGNRKLEQPRYHRAAAEGNFFLRGFHHLLLFKKERADPQRGGGGR